MILSTCVKDLKIDMDRIHSFWAGLRAHHRIGLSVPTSGTKPTFLQVYTYYGDELDDRMSLKVAGELNREVMSELQQGLHRINPSVREFKAVKKNRKVYAFSAIITGAS